MRRKKVLSLILFTAMVINILLLNGMAVLAINKSSTITVSNTQELLQAIAPNTTIVLSAGDYDLLSAGEVFNPYIQYSEEFDGKEVQIHGVENLAITAASGAQVNILTSPRYADVLSFHNSSNISLSGLIIGHFPELGECSGGVLFFESCSSIQVSNSTLFGCGTVGLTLHNVNGLQLADSIIRDCIYGFMNAFGSSNVTIVRSDLIQCQSGFYLNDSDVVIIDSTINDNTATSLFQMDATTTVTVRNTQIENNQIPQLYSGEGHILFEGVTFNNNTFATPYTVTFESNGGSAVISRQAISGAKVDKPADPTKSGFTFAGWFKEAACTNQWNFYTDTVQSNITLYAKWTEVPAQFTVTFESNGGSAVVNQLVTVNTKVTKPTDPIRTGYQFAGWFKDQAFATAWNFDTDVVTGNITLYAKWTPATAESKIRDFVTRFYTLFFGRPADEGGLNYWVGGLMRGEMTGAQVAAFFVDSQEFRNMNVNDNTFLTMMYRAFFNREPDSGGMAYWKSYLDNGLSRFWVLANFVNSPEFNEICVNFDIIRGQLSLSSPADIHPQLTMFVTRFYKLCLNRMPDADGANYWVSDLAAGRRTGAMLSYDFVFSTEFKNRNVSDTDYITILYNSFFSRAPDTGGLNYWQNQLISGNTRYNVLCDFVNSQEFTTICQNYGIVRGSLVPEPISPKFSTNMSDDIDVDMLVKGMVMWNQGTKPLRIFSAGARLIDADYYDFDRDLRLTGLVDNQVVYYNWVEIPPNTMSAVYFAVIGTSTWYDKYTTFAYDFSYDGVMYRGYSSYYYGDFYQKK